MLLKYSIILLLYKKFCNYPLFLIPSSLFTWVTFLVSIFNIYLIIVHTVYLSVYVLLPQSATFSYAVSFKSMKTAYNLDIPMCFFITYKKQFGVVVKVLGWQWEAQVQVYLQPRNLRLLYLLL